MNELMFDLIRLFALLVYIYVVARVVFAAYYRDKLKYHRRVIKEIEEGERK